MVFNVMTPIEVRTELKQRNLLARGSIGGTSLTSQGLIHDLRVSLMEAIEAEHKDMASGGVPFVCL